MQNVNFFGNRTTTRHTYPRRGRTWNRNPTSVRHQAVAKTNRKESHEVEFAKQVALLEFGEVEKVKVDWIPPMVDIRRPLLYVFYL
jgi:hypothetical protein